DIGAGKCPPGNGVGLVQIEHAVTAENIVAFPAHTHHADMKKLERLVEQRARWERRERNGTRNCFRPARILAAVSCQEKVLSFLPPAIPTPWLPMLHQGDIEVCKWEAPMVMVGRTVPEEDVGILIAVGVKIAHTIEGHADIGLVRNFLDIS